MLNVCLFIMCILHIAIYYLMYAYYDVYILCMLFVVVVVSSGFGQESHSDAPKVSQGTKFGSSYSDADETKYLKGLESGFGRNSADKMKSPAGSGLGSRQTSAEEAIVEQASEMLVDLLYFSEILYVTIKDIKGIETTEGHIYKIQSHLLPNAPDPEMTKNPEILSLIYKHTDDVKAKRSTSYINVLHVSVT